jgi:hypothetical protein
MTKWNDHRSRHSLLRRLLLPLVLRPREIKAREIISIYRKAAAVEGGVTGAGGILARGWQTFLFG